MTKSRGKRDNTIMDSKVEVKNVKKTWRHMGQDEKKTQKSIFLNIYD